MSEVVDLHSETLSEYLPDGPITSLRRIQATYGAIAEAAEGSASGEFGLYYTPGELDGFVTDGDEDRYLVTVKVDMTGSDPGLDDVSIELLREELVPKLGFSRFPWGRGIDHSITRRGAKGGSSVDTVTTYCMDCLVRWTDGDGREPAVGEIADTHSDGWIIQSLASLGGRDGIEDRIESILDQKMAVDSPRVVATVAIKIDPDELERPPEDDEVRHFWPGELHVFNAAMKARKDQKLAEKNVSEPSQGDGVCMITDDFGPVFGTVEDPIALFTVQHAEKFPRLFKQDAWRTHPVSADAALLLQSGASFVESCRSTREGMSVYVLPYFVEMDNLRVEALHAVLTSSDSGDMTRMEENVRDYGGDVADALRFYVISLRNDSGDINVLFEVPDATTYWPKQVADGHRATLAGSSFSESAGFVPPEHDWRALSAKTGTVALTRLITSGQYVRDTLGKSQSDDPTTDDAREWLTHTLLTGEDVPVNRLLSEYAARLEDERRSDDSEETLSKNHVMTQYAQFEALARAGLLSSTPGRAELTRPPMEKHIDHADGAVSHGRPVSDGGTDSTLPEPTDIVPDGDVSHLDARRYRLERFVDERPALSENPARQGAFLFGVLVGQLSEHQRSQRNMNRTLQDMHPPDQMTARRMRSLYPDLTKRSGLYASDNYDTLFPETEELLSEAFSYAVPDDSDWKLPVDDLRFFYALGITYGRQANVQANRLRKQLGLVEADD